MLSLKALLLPLAGAVLLGASNRPADPVVSVVATDFHLALPATLPAGPTTFQLVNQGKLPHHMVVVRMPAGKTVADLLKGFSPEGAPPRWAVMMGGPNAVDPGATSAPVTVNLTPGNYAALCMIPVPGGVPHMVEGMITAFAVTPSPARTVASHPADETVTLVDYAFHASKPLTAGQHTILVRNDGMQPHELELVQLAPGTSVQELEQWIGAAEHSQTPPDGPPPAHFLGGVAPLSPGQQNEMAVSLAPGRYAFVCFLPGPDGKPHFMHGMAQEFDVK